MWKCKQILTGLALVVGLVSVAGAAEATYKDDVYPMTFGSGMSEANQLAMWKRLMKYKLFATGLSDGSGIFAEERVHITDEVGYIGSATGNLKFQNNEHEFGGPILFGGGFQAGTGGDKFINGPTRFEGAFNAGAGGNSFAGKYCFDGGYNTNAQNGVTAAGGQILTSAQCQSTNEVYAVDTDLDVPSLGVQPTRYEDAIYIDGGNAANRVKYIHVPPTLDSSAYNYYVKAITFSSNGGKLHIVMPPEGRLTKIFVEGAITMGSSDMEIVVVPAKNGTWDGSKWVGFDDVPLENGSYAGNLLFYTPQNLEFPTSNKTIQGTFISTGNIKLGHHTHFAGQLLAKYIHIGADFDAKDFQYVPFNPPLINLSLAVNDKISEDDVVKVGEANYYRAEGGSPLNISLSKNAETDVKFNYCFEFNGVADAGTNLAKLNDVRAETSNKSAYNYMPLCGKDSAAAVIPFESKTLATPIKIWVEDDDIVENRETFKLKIFNLTGGVFKDNSREWPVNMSIYDNDNVPAVPPVITPSCPADPKFTIAEDGLLTIPSFTVKGTDESSNEYMLDDFTVRITTLPSKGDLTYGGTKITSSSMASTNISTIALENNYLQFKPVADAYGTPYATIKYSISYTSEDNVERSATGCTWTVNVTAVNDAPVVKNYEASIREDAAVGTKLPVRIDASDKENDKLTYKITQNNGESGKTFEIVDGYIYLREALDYEKISRYPLVVEVSDGKLSSFLVATINVIDVNEKPEGKDILDSIQENVKKGTVVAYIAADDPEEGYKPLNFEILEADMKLLFSVEAKSGEYNKAITVVGAVDYETVDTQYEHCSANASGEKICSFTVRVSDNGKVSGGKESVLYTDIKVKIKILDENEPVSAKGFTVEIPENTAVGTEVAKSITVTDEDDKTHKFSIFSGNGEGSFKIDAKTGVISVVKSLDYERTQSYKFVVEVRDTRATGSLVDTAIVNINILDVNEPPSIKDDSFTVPENKPVGTVVGTIPVTDEDIRAENLQNKFTLSGEDAKYFKIDEKTGEIKTNAVFDFESKNEYKFVVTVKDQDDNSSTANVVVKIKDVVETSSVVVNRVETGSGASAWSKDTLDLTKTVILSNEKSVVIQWAADGKALPDTLVENLKEGFNKIELNYCDPSKNGCTKAEVVVFVSTKTPEVSVSAKENQASDKNIYTIAEEKTPGDTSIYVNTSNGDLSITVREPVLDSTYTDSTCNYVSTSVKVNTKLETVKVPEDTYKALNEIIKEAPTLNVAPAGGVTYTPHNDSLVKVSYTETTKTGKKVEISYVTDSKGDVVKQAIIGANGKIDSVEVIKVTYKVSVDGKLVDVSYEADAATGQPLKTIVAGSNGTTGSTGSAQKPGSGSTGSGSTGNGSAAGAATVNKSLTSGEVLFTVTYEYESKTSDGNNASVNVSYTVDNTGKVTKDKDGNVGYQVTYTYTNSFGNSASESVFIIVDVIPPVVHIVSPRIPEDSAIYSNEIPVEWTVDLGDGRGPQKQDSLTMEGLEAGKVNEIVRIYRDKAGNEAKDVVYVLVKKAKDVNVEVEKPVTIVTREDIEKYYASEEYKPKKDQTFAVSILNPTENKEIETIIGGGFKNQAGSGKPTYPDSLQGTHLGPTLGIEAKLPTLSTVGGLATLDDLVGADGNILLDKVDAVGSKKVTVEEYVHDYCTAEFQGNVGSDISKANLYKTTMDARIWVYTTLGNFVDEFRFTQDLNDPSYVSDGGVLKLYFEQKPDENGDVRTKDGRLYATGAYIYKTEISLRSTLQCTLPPVDDVSKKNVQGAKLKTKENLLKPFGYKRPPKK